MARSETKRIQLTKNRIEQFGVPRKRQTVYDEEVSGLGLRLEATGRRTFFWFRAVDKKLVFRTIGQFPTLSLEKARANAQELNSERANWKASDKTQANPFISEARKDPVTFAQLVQRYITSQIRPKAHHPEEAERQFTWVYEKYLREFDTRPITSLTRKEVKEFRSSLLAKQVAPFSADLAVKLIQRVYSWAIKEELFDRANPATKIEFRPSERDRFLQPDELARLDEAMKTEPDLDLVDFVKIAKGSAARKGMIISADWRELNFKREHPWTVPPLKMKGRRDKVKPFTPWLSPEARQTLERRWRDAGEPTEGFVFPSHTRQRKYRSSFNREFAHLLAKAKITGVTIHDLRRTRLSYAAMAGVPLAAISRMAGHASLTPTMRYARLHDEAVEEASRKTDVEMERQMSEARQPAKLRLVK